MKKYHIKKFFNFEYSFMDIYNYFIGNFRYFLYTHQFDFLIRRHIRQQIYYRIQVMDQECFLSGSCKICGCNTPHLQMANKTCEGNCYPVMMSRLQWKIFKIKNNLEDVGKP